MSTVPGNQYVDPDLLAVAGEYRLPAPSVAALAEIRSAPARPVELSDAVERTDAVVPGEPPVAVRVHRPRGLTGPSPAVVALHGGGLVFGSYDMDDLLFDRWCRKFGLVGVSVEYRLAPETSYPGPVEDAHRALVWAYDHAGELQIDRDNIGLYGISAGGCLAAGLALRARDESSVPLRYVLLETPMLDDRPTPSMSRDGLLVWTKEWNEFGWRSYLGSLYGSEDVPAYAAPGRAEQLGGLPPTFVSIGSADGFLDEDVEFAMGMNRCGSPCDLHVYAGLAHGYRLAPQSGPVKQAVADMEGWLRRQIS